jgi:hypothetical protein
VSSRPAWAIISIPCLKKMNKKIFNSEWILVPNVRAKIMKLLEENIGEHF